MTPALPYQNERPCTGVLILLRDFSQEFHCAFRNSLQ